jgi:hypothetical protein
MSNKIEMYSLVYPNSRQEQGIFLFFAASRPALWPTHPPSQLIPGILLPVLKGPGREADHSPPSSPEVKNGGAIPTYVPPYVFMA